MMFHETVPLFRDDPYMRRCDATVLEVASDGAIQLDRTVFYATSGGQPGDTGRLVADTEVIEIGAAIYGGDKALLHIPAGTGGAGPLLGGLPVRAEIDWPRRHRHMRMHTALHLMCSLIPFPVTGGSIGADESRLDFDISDAGAVDKDDLTERLNALAAADHAVTTRWISDEELADNPGLVRTMSVKPPSGAGRVRLVAIGEDGAVDLQPCGGTHVRSTAEIGRLAVTKIEKKGRLNRRIRLALVDPS
jgi:misacylated tRNA(Ala) deacylase